MGEEVGGCAEAVLEVGSCREEHVPSPEHGDAEQEEDAVCEGREGMVAGGRCEAG